MNLYKMKQDIKKNSFIDYKVDYIGFITVLADIQIYVSIGIEYKKVVSCHLK